MAKLIAAQMPIASLRLVTMRAVSKVDHIFWKNFFSLATMYGCDEMSRGQLEAELNSHCKERGSRLNLNSFKLCDCNNCNRQGAITCEIDGPGVKPAPPPPPPPPPPTPKEGGDW
jgi:predicted DNA-binding ribbon-helix-helix protein